MRLRGRRGSGLQSCRAAGLQGSGAALQCGSGLHGSRETPPARALRLPPGPSETVSIKVGGETVFPRRLTTLPYSFQVWAAWGEPPLPSEPPPLEY